MLILSVCLIIINSITALAILVFIGITVRDILAKRKLIRERDNARWKQN